jgi:hypothetical protein
MTIKVSNFIEKTMHFGKEKKQAAELSYTVPIDTRINSLLIIMVLYLYNSTHKFSEIF